MGIPAEPGLGAEYGLRGELLLGGIRSVQSSISDVCCGRGVRKLLSADAYLTTILYTF